MKEKSFTEIPLTIRQELAYVLRRIENDLDVEKNMGRLWRLCANYRMEGDLLIPFIKSAALNPDKVLRVLAQPVPDVPDEKRIAVITCVNDDRKYEETLLYLERCSLPDDMKMEFIPIYHAKSMASGYQEGMASSRAKYKIYIHQDLCLVEKEALRIMLGIFQAHPEIGMIGFAGCEHLSPSGLWYDTAETRYGVALQAVSPEEIVRLYFSETKKGFEPVEAIDGIFMMTQYDVPWREDVFRGWHFYDISQSVEFRKKGYGIAVPGSDHRWCIHDSSSAIGEDYENYRRIFIEEYRDFLRNGKEIR